MTDIAVGCLSFDRFLKSGFSAWKQECGDTRSASGSATNRQVLSEVRDHITVFESKSDYNLESGKKMAASAPDEPTHSASERSGPRPLKSRPEDRIASIMDNPFYKSFGVKHPRSPRDVPSAPASAKTTADSDGKYAVREDLGDYRPGSGFVHKLMGRFASMEMREEGSSIPHIKAASSVEDILDRTESRAADTNERHRERGRLNSAQHRTRSVESISRRKGSLNLPVVLRHVERGQDRPASSMKSPRDTHIVAPDVKLGRDDIILIENPPSEHQPGENGENGIEDKAAMGSHTAGFNTENSVDELPKPNTVSAVRSLFESGKPLSPTSDLPGDAFSLDGESSFTPRDSVLTPRDPIVTPRGSSSTPRDSNSTPRDTVLPSPRNSYFSFSHQDTVLTPREPKDLKTTQDSRPYKLASPRISSDITQKYDVSKNRFSWSSDLKTAGSGESSTSAAPPPLPYTFPPVSASAASSTADTIAESEVSENVKPSLFHTSNSAENRPIASPRSTAAVKAIPVSRPSVPARSSIPNSTTMSSSGTVVPPSFTPNIKKTSPVMPVAPFKENKTDEGGDNRYLIYEKKSSKAKTPKAMRLKDYGEESTDLALENTKNVEASDDLKKQGNNVKKSNKVNGTHTKGRAPPVPRRRQSEESVLSPRSSESNDTPWADMLKPVSPRIEDSQPQPVTLSPVEPAKPSKAPRTFFTKPEEKMETHQSLAPSEESKMDTEEASQDEGKTEDSDQPVRGIPSIIANRMKQTNQKQGNESPETKRPGELFGVCLGKTPHGHGKDSTEEENEIPRKRLAPATQKTENNASQNLPSEIENQIASVRKRMEHASRNKPTGVSQIFDSSQLQKKKKQKSGAAAGVPRLDLSSITSEDSSNAGSSGGYRVTPREIKPCNIEFIGANVSLGRSLLEKNRKEKARITFHTRLEETFEYPSEDSMLEDYLRQHPNEVLVLEESSSSWSAPESSSDDADLPETPRGGGSSLDNELLKSNTSLAHTGSLQSYRGKFQQEYELGSVLNMPEKEPEPVVTAVEPANPDSMQILPADEDDNQTWSVDTSSDLLF